MTAPAPEPRVVIMPGACTNRPSDMAAMRQQTHDGLLDLVGSAPHGPVQWRHVHGRAECTRLLRALFAGDDRPSTRFGLDQFEAHFEQYPLSCVLIIASCEVHDG